MGLVMAADGARPQFERGYIMEETMTKAEAHELREKLDALKKDFADTARLAKDRAVTGTADWAKEHPLPTLGIVAGIAASIGFAIGLMVGRNRN
jgi:ElaB/YqjD/DUF883 family membrane-anchored ribosome-binding protein